HWNTARNAFLASTFRSPQLNVADVGVTEGNSGQTNAAFNLTLTFPTDQAVSVKYATADGTAKAGEDYLPVSGTVSFGPNETVKTINVPVLGDTKPEPTETFSLN